MKVKNLVFLILFILLAAGCQENKPVAQQGKQVIPVRVQKVKLQDIDRSLEYVGNIKARDEVAVYPKVSGKIIEKVKQEGDVVNKGDTIAYIDRDEVGLKFEKAPVESPLAGVVGRVYVDIGSNVSVQSPVALVVNMDSVKIELDIPEVYLPNIFLGQEAGVSVDAYPQEKFWGKITKINPVVNLENRAVTVDISMENPKRLLKSGMFVEVILPIEKRRLVPVIIKEAIIGKAPDAYVYTVEDEKAVMHKISLGIHDGPLYEVTTGLKEGDMVVVMGQQRLYDKAPVSAETGNNGNGTVKE